MILRAVTGERGHGAVNLVEQKIDLGAVIGDGLRFHTDEAQVTEVAIAVEVLNRMLDLGRPNSVHVT